MRRFIESPKKPVVLSLILLSSCLLGLNIYVTHTNTGEQHESTDTWFAQAQQSICASEYNIRSVVNDNFLSINRNNTLKTQYSKTDFAITPLFDNNETWRVQLSLLEISKGGTPLLPNEQCRQELSDNYLYYKHPGFTIEYVNNRDGMRQNFIIDKRPEGNEPLRARLRYTGSLEVHGENNAALFGNSSGTKFCEKLRYDGLKAWDADGKLLDAGMYVENDVITLAVNDVDARYPVTIDPLSTTPSWTHNLYQTNAQFGYSMACAGDVNNDGYDDVIVGAPGYTNGQSAEGAAFVFYGSSTGLSTTANWSVEGNIANLRFGHSVSCAGDINNDGYDDIIIGTPDYVSSSLTVGKAYVYHGSYTGLASGPNWTVAGTIDGEDLGYSVACAGDVNGDGYDDVIIGAPGYTNGQTEEGRASVFYGSSSGLASSAAWQKESNQANARYGFSVSSAGDVNNDTYSDIIIGSPYYTNGTSLEGKVFVYHGSSSGLSSTANWSTEGEQVNATYGFSTACAGDVNGDGYDDIIIGAPMHDKQTSDEGLAYVFLGSSSGLNGSAVWILESAQTSAELGYSVAGAGDINNDGYDDIVIGAPNYDDGQSDEGRIYVYRGTSTGIATTANMVVESNQAGALLGYSVAGAGDNDNNGKDGVLASAPKYDFQSAANTGRGYMFGNYDTDDFDKGSRANNWANMPVVIRSAYTNSQASLKFNLHTYPNPTNKYLNVEAFLPQGTPYASVLITTIHGRVLEQFNLPVSVNALSNLRIPVGNLVNGNYIVSIKTPSAVVSKSFAVLH